ncbi:ATP-dependent Clp protease ATP-binding subunit [Streptomyces rectiverticillatus]|uniref:Clp protease N-terminal domain-containing protein n=1 Tax=Streptomyces rectiverticillatus TaxID=173860 RepID=UPI0015C34B06|nr:Clp protease N-terminal domain-containing protein [Streptomyces rectiverticillatus]QLE75419.1 ATP-dependent Clp protease ATP-binding subunit [Streptomyces rectiverticillatus]
MDEPVTLGDLVHRVTRLHPDGDALVHLSDAIVMSELIGDVADQLVGYFVDAARKEGLTWADIGSTMGVTRQAAQKRFVHKPTTAGMLAVGTLDPATYERFTPRARAVITASQEEARAAGHDYLGTEHLVLGLLSQPAGLAAKYLLEKTTPEQLRTAMGEVLGPRRDNVPEQIPYTPRGKRSVELSLLEAQRLGHEHVGTEHLLLGVLAEQHGVGAKVLLGLGVERRGVEEWLATQ